MLSYNNGRMNSDSENPSIVSPSLMGRYIALVREKAGLTQAQLANSVTFSTATLSRIESGEKSVTTDEIVSLLQKVPSPLADQLREFLAQNWDHIERPAFDHPNREALWKANTSLQVLSRLRLDPDLKAVFFRQIELYETEVRRVSAILASLNHQIVYIGSIGVGKSTAICKLTGLLKPGEQKLDRQIVLETGAGGITLCEVHITQGPCYGIRIVPRSEESIRRDVEDFADYLITSLRQPSPSADSPDQEDGDRLGISKEVVRAIRNMADLTEKRKEENGRRVRIDPAKELAAQFSNSQDLCIHILTKMDLLRRNSRDAWYPDDHAQLPSEWLQEIFVAINNGRHPGFSLPQKIEVIVPNPIFARDDLALRIIDTKGIDQTAERQDLECHFDDPKTLVVLCSRFNDAPEVPLQTLLNRAKEGGARELALKTVILVLARPEEALAVKYDDGVHVSDDEEGYDLKRDQIKLRLDQRGCPNVPVEFFNAREESPDGLRDRLTKRVEEQRSYFAGQIDRLSESVDHLSKNRGDEQIRMVFEHVIRDLSSWITNNRIATFTSTLR